MDHEIGTWVPALTSSGSTFSYSNRSGSYIKTGKWVTVTGKISLNASGNTFAANPVYLSGLPYAVHNEGSGEAAVAAAVHYNVATAMLSILLLANNGGASAILYKVTAGYTGSPATLNGNDIANSFLLHFTFTYRAA